jgi:DNA-binding GntR family transcriptional regulator
MAETDDSRSLADQAYTLIKEAVICCKLEPGDPITEEQLATETRFGRAAVRTAIKRLCQEKLVDIGPRQRYIVTPITLRHVNELFEVRRLLEPTAARLAARSIDIERLVRLEELCKARYLVGDADSSRVFLRHNTEFHTIVARASSNEVLVDVLVGVLEKIERVHHLGHMLRDRNEQAFHEHHDLVEALADHDGDRAYEITCDQIGAAQRFAVEGLLNSPSVQLVNVGKAHTSRGTVDRSSRLTLTLRESNS